MTTGMASTKRSWWRQLSKTLLDSEASQFLQEHGDRACAVARKAARTLGTNANLGRRGTFHILHCALAN